MDTVSYMLGKRAGGGTITESDPIFSASASAGITSSDITNWNNKQDVIQYSTMPTANADNLGKIVQYTGATDSTYTNGYFYKCVSDGASTPTYSWEEVEVQASGGGGTVENLFPVYDFECESVTNLVNGRSSSLNSTDKAKLSGFINDAYSKGYKNIGINIKTVNTTGDGYGMLLSSIDPYYGKRTNIQNKTMSHDLWGVMVNDLADAYNTVLPQMRTMKLQMTISWSSDVARVNFAYLTYCEARFLTTINNTDYTPLTDYNPATKKYVDDKITSYSGYDASKTQILKNVNGTITWVDES